jgi:hypothetical protein
MALDRLFVYANIWESRRPHNQNSVPGLVFQVKSIHSDKQLQYGIDYFDDFATAFIWILRGKQKQTEARITNLFDYTSTAKVGNELTSCYGSEQRGNYSLAIVHNYGVKWEALDSIIMGTPQLILPQRSNIVFH